MANISKLLDLGATKVLINELPSKTPRIKALICKELVYQVMGGGMAGLKSDHSYSVKAFIYVDCA